MNSKEWMNRELPVVLVILVVILIAAVIRSFSLPSLGKDVRVGVVLIGPRMDRGWNEAHYIGLAKACRGQKCALSVRENVEEFAVANAVDELINEGASVIYLTSVDYGKHVDDIAAKYPNVMFYSVSGEGAARNIVPYFVRMYQARYLSGIVAGAASRTGVLGYVAAIPNAQTNRGINAYAMGMRRANPKAKLLVHFIGSWSDEEKERESVDSLARAGADVFTCHTDMSYAVREADQRGFFTVGYSAVHEGHSDHFLTAALYDWDILYEKVLGDYMSGRASRSSADWLDISRGGVKLYQLSPLVSEETAALIEQEKERITMNQDVFSGLIYDHRGRIRCEEGERISDQELFNGMEWFVEGVEIYE